MNNSPELAVGNLNGGFVLYDPDIQDKRDLSQVILWNAQSFEYSSHQRAETKLCVKRITDEATREKVISKYQDFIKGGQNLDFEELSAYEYSDRRKSVGIVLHQRRLKLLNIDYNGIRHSKKKPRNVSCYNCKKRQSGGGRESTTYRMLGESDNFSCVNCDWLICLCGACGCGWKREIP